MQFKQRKNFMLMSKVNGNIYFMIIRIPFILYVIIMNVAFNIFSLKKYQGDIQVFTAKECVFFIAAFWFCTFFYLFQFLNTLIFMKKAELGKGKWGALIIIFLITVYVLTLLVGICCGTQFRFMWEWLPVYDTYIGILSGAFIMQEAVFGVFYTIYAEKKTGMRTWHLCYSGIMLSFALLCLLRVPDAAVRFLSLIQNRIM